MIASSTTRSRGVGLFRPAQCKHPKQWVSFGIAEKARTKEYFVELQFFGGVLSLLRDGLSAVALFTLRPKHNLFDFLITNILFLFSTKPKAFDLNTRRSTVPPIPIVLEANIVI